jgi:lipoprotein signal peptidase
MQRWPIFNIADSFVTTGMVFLVVHYMFLEKKPGIRE